VSGPKEPWPTLNRLTIDAHRRRFAVLLAWKIDRFGRSLRRLVNALADLDARNRTCPRVEAREAVLPCQSSVIHNTDT
jgi:DNA invertase Pin-like site-specific DNA recombinase